MSTFLPKGHFSHLKVLPIRKGMVRGHFRVASQFGPQDSLSSVASQRQHLTVGKLNGELVVEFTRLPAHQLLPQILKLRYGETFRKNVSKLLGGNYFHHRNRASYQLLAEPVCFHGVMFGTRCKLRRHRFRQD